jgi:GTPase SAR1 family protein
MSQKPSNPAAQAPWAGVQLKLALLGPASSGKSTFFKQLLVDPQGVLLGRYAAAAQENVIRGLRAMCELALQLHMQLSDTSAATARELLELEQPPRVSRLLGDVWAQRLMQLWQEPALQQIYRDRHSYPNMCLQDGLGPLLARSPVVLHPRYRATSADAFCAHCRTTGVEEHTLSYQGGRFVLCDVGGTRSERRRWIHCYDSLDAVLFFASLADYPLQLAEDETTNRMLEALQLFQEIAGSAWFRRLPLVLILSRLDVLEHVAPNHTISDVFPDSPPDMTAAGVRAILEERFQQAAVAADAGDRLVGIFSVNLLDDSAVRRLWDQDVVPRLVDYARRHPGKA